MDPTIVVLGATGYTGGLVVESLVRRGRRPVLAGRSPQRLAVVAARHGGLDTRIADVASAATVRDLLAPGDVLVTTVGPFERYGRAAAQAAAEVGAHYVDTTGEVGFVQHLRDRYDEVARGHGATMLPAFGYDFVPGVLAGTLAAEKAGSAADTLRVGYYAIGSVARGLSSGTRATLADGLLVPVIVRRDGVLTTARAASAVYAPTVRGSRRSSFLVSGTESLFLPEHFPQLRTVEVFNGWFPRASRALGAASWAVNGLARWTWGRRLVEAGGKAATRSTGGPDAAERARTRTHVVAQVTGASGRVVSEVHLEGPSIYSLTGELVALAADRLASGGALRSGVVSPADAFGADGLREACAAIGLEVVPR